MKLKVLPPTLRKNNHYIVVDVYSEVEITKNDLVNIIWDGCIRYSGEGQTANFNLWVMRFKRVSCKLEYFYYQAIIRCQRDYKDDVRAALTCISQYKFNRISIITIGVSGTIKSGENKFFQK